MANPIRKIVQLVLDKNAASKMEGDAKKSLGGVDKALGTLKKAAIGLGAALASAFAIRKVAQFGKEVVKVAAEAEEIWNRLGHAVENAGKSMAEMRPEIDAFARAMQDVTTVGDEDFAKVMTELLTITNDYGRSINNVGTVADLAAAKQMDLTAAAKLVGLAIQGETGTFKRYGIVVKEGETAIEALRRSFRGFAESEARTLNGRLKQLNNEWGDFKQAVGDALIIAGGGTSVIESLTVSLKVLTDWVNANRDAFAALGEVIAQLQDPLILVVDVLAKYLRFLERAGNIQAGLSERGGFAFEKLFGDPAELRERAKLVGRMADGMDDLVRSMNEAQRNRAAGIALPPPYVAVTGPDPAATPPSPDGGGALVESAETYAELLARLHREYQDKSYKEYLERQKEGWAGLNSEMEMSAKNAAKLGDGFAQAGEDAQNLQNEVFQIGRLATVAGDLLYGAFGTGIPELAAQKAKQNAILAAEQAVQGLVLASNPVTAAKAGIHFKAAAEYGAIAAAWGALAGATGGFSGGGGGGSGSPSDTGGAASERAEPPGDEVHIHFVGPGFSAVNPEVQKVVYGAALEAAKNYGPNAKVKYHRSPRG